MRAIICGGRDYSDKTFLDYTLDRYHEIYHFTCIIQGGATGADYLASRWAESKNIICDTYPAHWTIYGKSAGHKRNLEMIEKGKPDIVIAFPGGVGTENMVQNAVNLGIKIIRVGI
jgi:hypothetical protein